MRKIGYLVSSFMLLSLFLPTLPTLASTCNEPGTIEEAFEIASAVVVGTVTHISKNPFQDKKIYLDVQTSYKGYQYTQLSILEDSLSGTSKKGATYLYFLHELDGKLSNSPCSATTPYTTTQSENPYWEGKELPLVVVEEQSPFNYVHYTIGFFISLLAIIISFIT